MANGKLDGSASGSVYVGRRAVDFSFREGWGRGSACGDALYETGRWVSVFKGGHTIDIRGLGPSRNLDPPNGFGRRSVLPVLGQSFVLYIEFINDKVKEDTGAPQGKFRRIAGAHRDRRVNFAGRTEQQWPVKNEWPTDAYSFEEPGHLNSAWEPISRSAEIDGICSQAARVTRAENKSKFLNKLVRTRKKFRAVGY